MTAVLEKPNCLIQNNNKSNRGTEKINNHRRMDIYFADLRGGNAGSEQSGKRPVLVIQNDQGNKFSPTTIVITISTSATKAKLPTHVELEPNKTGLKYMSVLLAEQIRTVDEYRLISKVGSVDIETRNKIDNALRISLGI